MDDMTSFRSTSFSSKLRLAAAAALVWMAPGCSSDEPPKPAAEAPAPEAPKMIEGVVRPSGETQAKKERVRPPLPTYPPEVEAKIGEVLALPEDAPDTVMKIDPYLADEHPAVRTAAASMLEDVGGSLAIQRLQVLVVEDQDEGVRLRAIESLEYIGGDDAEAGIAKALGDSSPRVRGEAAAVLAYLESVEQLDALKAARAAEQDEALQSALDEAIEEVSDAAAAEAAEGNENAS